MNLNRVKYVGRKFRDRLQMVLSDFFRMWRHYSLRYAVYCSVWWISNYLGLKELNLHFTQKKQGWLDKYIEQNYADIIARYRDKEESTTLSNPYKVWVFWGQGEKEMPQLVQACCSQMCVLNSRGGVNLLNLENIENYVKLPDFVYVKLKQGKLLYAHFSDILRNSLLAEYGGMWLDATCWTAHPVPDIARESVFFSPHNAADGTYWCTYAMGSNCVGSVTFSFVRDMLIAVCEREKVWPDYLFQDRLLSFAHRKLKAAKQAIDSAPTNATRRFLLYPMMNKVFDKEYYRQLVATDWLFKMSYKSYFKKECDGNPTFYAAMLDGTMNEV